MLRSYGVDVGHYTAAQKVPPYNGNGAIDEGVGVEEGSGVSRDISMGTAQKVFRASAGTPTRKGRKGPIGGRGAKQRELQPQHASAQSQQAPQKPRRGLLTAMSLTSDQVTDVTSTSTSTACDPATMRYVPGPLQHGFAEYVAMEEGQLTPRKTVLHGSLYHKGAQHLVRNDLPYWPSGHMLSERQALEAIRIMNTSHNEGRPFYLHVWFDAPHTPYELHEQYAHVYPTALRKELSANHFAYLTMISALDAAVGRIRSFLQQSGLAKDTLVVFTSDNGPEVMAGSAEPFRGRKRALFEGGLRVPCIFEWFGRIVPSTTTNAFAVTTDLFPTFLHAAGISAWGEAGSGSLKIDGLSILNLLLAPPGVHRQVDYSWGRRPEYGNTSSVPSSAGMEEAASSDTVTFTSHSTSSLGVTPNSGAFSTTVTTASPLTPEGPSIAESSRCTENDSRSSRQLHMQTQSTPYSVAGSSSRQQQPQQKRSVAVSSSLLSSSQQHQLQQRQDHRLQQKRTPGVKNFPSVFHPQNQQPAQNFNLTDIELTIAGRNKSTPAAMSSVGNLGLGDVSGTEALTAYRNTLRFPFYPTLAAYYAALVPPRPQTQHQHQPELSSQASKEMVISPKSMIGISKIYSDSDSNTIIRDSTAVDDCKSNLSTSARMVGSGTAGVWDMKNERDDIYNGRLDSVFVLGQGGAGTAGTAGTAGADERQYDPYPGYRDRTVVWFSATNNEASAAWKDGVKYVAEVGGGQHIYNMHRDDWRAEYRDLVRFPRGATCHHKQLCRGVGTAGGSSGVARNRAPAGGVGAVHGRAKPKPVAGAKTVTFVQCSGLTAESPIVKHLQQRSTTFAKQVRHAQVCG